MIRRICSLVDARSRSHARMTSFKFKSSSSGCGRVIGGGLRLVAPLVAPRGRFSSARDGWGRDVLSSPLSDDVPLDGAFRTQTPEADGVRRSLSASGVVGAERGGFEPPIPFSQYNGLANRRFRPLSHLSGCRDSEVSADGPGESNKDTKLGSGASTVFE